MKSVGQQLQEARLAKNWTPELAARETKIKVDRVRDLEADDYTHFSSPAYARGFVRTYARALGLDEYKILRQLDNKLPEDDNASFANDAGMPYVPEPSQTMHVSSAPRTGLYIVFGLFCAVVIVISSVLLQAYRAGELPRYFASTANTDNPPSINSTNSAPVPDAEAPAHALPVDPNDTTHSVRALPVDTTAVAAAPADTNAAPSDTNAAPADTNAVPASTTTTAITAPAVAESQPPVAAPAPETAPQPASATNLAPEAATPPGTDAAPVAVAVNSAVPPAPAAVPPVADNAPTPTAAPAAAAPPTADTSATDTAPVNPAGAADVPAAATNAAPVAMPVAIPVAAPVSPAPVASAEPEPKTAPAAPRESSKGSTVLKAPAAATPPPRALPVSASELAADEASGPTAISTPPPATADGNTTVVDLGASAAAPAPAAKRLVLTASRDSFVRVTSLDGGRDGVLYASVLRQGQSLAFDGHKFSVNVGVPSAVDIMLDGVNYGPHSDGESPETFTLESHQP